MYNNNDESWGLLIFTIFGNIALILLLMYLGVTIWNYLVPELFGFSEITFSKMFWLIILINIIFPGNSRHVSVNK